MSDANDSVSDENCARVATTEWVEGVANAQICDVAAMVFEDPSVVAVLIGALRHARAELARIRPVYEAACEYRDADVTDVVIMHLLCAVDVARGSRSNG